MLTAGCTNTNRAREQQNSQNPQLGEDLNLAHLPGGPARPFQSNRYPLPTGSMLLTILTCVALETGVGSQKKGKACVSPEQGDEGASKAWAVAELFPVLLFGEKQDKAKLPTPCEA